MPYTSPFTGEHEKASFVFITMYYVMERLTKFWLGREFMWVKQNTGKV